MILDALAIDFNVWHNRVDWCLGSLLLDESSTVGLAARLPTLINLVPRDTSCRSASTRKFFLGMLRRSSASACPKADGIIHVDPRVDLERFGTSHESIES